MEQTNFIQNQPPISGHQVPWFSRRLRFSIWFPIIIVVAFAAGYLFWQKTLIPGPYDLEPVSVVRNNNNPQEANTNLVEKFVTEGLEGYKTYRNDKYRFEFKFPNYFKPVTANLEEFHGESSQLDWIDVVVYPRSPDGFEYANQPGGFSFRYDAVSDGWIPVQTGVPLKFAPQKLYTDKNLSYFYVKTGDAATVEEKVFLFNANSSFVVEISVYRNMSYVDCINPCPEQKPFSDHETILKILSTFRFIDEDKICIQVITPARNPQTGETRDFPTPCDVPEGWEIIK